MKKKTLAVGYPVYIICLLAWFLGVFARFARENTQKPDKKTTKTQPNSGMQVVLGVLTLRGGTRYASCYGMPNLNLMTIKNDQNPT